MATKNQKGKRTDDRFELLRSGGIELAASGTRYRLGRPTIGEQRRFVEALTDIADIERKANEADAAERDTGERPEAPSHDDVNAALLNWWRDVVSALSDGELPADDDDLPPWLLQRPLLSEVRRHWLEVPWVPGGSPEERNAKAASDLAPVLAQLGPLLAAQAQQPTS